MGQKEMEVQEKKKYLKALGKSLEEEEKVDAATLAKEHVQEATKKKEELERVMREKSKKLDYLVRATRLEEIPLIQQREAQALKQNLDRYEKDIVEKAKNAKLQWQKDVEQKQLLSSFQVFDATEEFFSLVMMRRQFLHEQKCSVVLKQAQEDEQQK